MVSGVVAIAIFVMGVLITISIICVVLVLVTKVNKGTQERKILNELLASGQISQEEYNVKIKQYKK